MPENKNQNSSKANKDFAWFVDQVHKPLASAKAKNLTLEEANKYADKGVEILQSLTDGKIDLNTNSVDAANYILWAMVRFSYQNGYVFGKGMFNIIFSDDVNINKKAVQRLDQLLMKNAYSRLSSHYADAIISPLSSKRLGLSVVRGIDIDHSKIPFPANFETILFTQIHLNDANDKRFALAFKPETSSFDISRPEHAFKHARNWIESSKNQTNRTPAETQAYREKPGKANKEYQFNPNIPGSVLVFKVTSVGLVQEPKHRLLPKTKGPSL